VFQKSQFQLLDLEPGTTYCLKVQIAPDGWEQLGETSRIICVETHGGTHSPGKQRQRVEEWQEEMHREKENRVIVRKRASSVNFENCSYHPLFFVHLQISSFWQRSWQAVWSSWGFFSPALVLHCANSSASETPSYLYAQTTLRTLHFLQLALSKPHTLHSCTDLQLHPNFLQHLLFQSTVLRFSCDWSQDVYLNIHSFLTLSLSCSLFFSKTEVFFFY